MIVAKMMAGKWKGIELFMSGNLLRIKKQLSMRVDQTR